MDKMGYIHAMKRYSAINWNEVLVYATTRINLKNKKPDTKGQMVHDSIYTQYGEQANPDTEVEWWLPGTRSRG